MSSNTATTNTVPRCLDVNDPCGRVCGGCDDCLPLIAANDDGRDEAFALVGLDGAADDETSAPRRCPGGCFGGYVADPRGPSAHNPTGEKLCPVCG